MDWGKGMGRAEQGWEQSGIRLNPLMSHTFRTQKEHEFTSSIERSQWLLLCTCQSGRYNWQQRYCVNKPLRISVNKPALCVLFYYPIAITHDWISPWIPKILPQRCSARFNKIATGSAGSSHLVPFFWEDVCWVLSLLPRQNLGFLSFGRQSCWISCGGPLLARVNSICVLRWVVRAAPVLRDGRVLISVCQDW